jgi:hypothetical protein
MKPLHRFGLASQNDEMNNRNEVFLSRGMKIVLIVSAVLWAIACSFPDQLMSLMPGVDVLVVQRMLLLVILLTILMRRVVGARRQRVEAAGKE